MSDDSAPFDGRQPDTTAPQATPEAADMRPELRLAVVQYEKRPDLGTIYPPDRSGVERMNTWISASMRAFRDLAAWR